MTFPFTIIPAYQELYDAVTSNGKTYDPTVMNDTLVALFNSFFSLGLIVGPLAGSYITLATNFRICTESEALFLFGFFLLYLSFVYIPMKVSKKNNSKKTAEIDAMSKDSGIAKNFKEELL